MQIRIPPGSADHHLPQDEIISGNDPAWQLDASHQETTMEQHSDSQESMSVSEESTSDSDLDSDSDPFNLDPTPLVELFGDNLFAQGMCEWLTTTKYGVPEQDRLALPDPRPVDPDVNKPKDYRLVCPFYLNDPEGYQSCLEDPLHTIYELKLHINKIHPMPPYCAICREPFDTASSRDVHTRARACERDKHGIPQGYDETQMRRLWKRDKDTMPDAERWMNIYLIGFNLPKGEFPSKVAYLTDDLGLVITKIYDYINVFLAIQTRDEYLRFIWYELKATGWLNAFIRHYLDHVQPHWEATSLAENEAARISHCLNIWLRQVFPINGAYRQLEFSDLYPQVIGMSELAYTQQSTCNFCVTFTNISSDLPTAHNLCRKRQRSFWERDF